MKTSPICFLLIAVLLAGCTVDEARPHEPGDGASSSPAARAFERLAGDQPGGPRLTGSLPARPSQEVLEAAAQAGPSRLSAETFAILVNHAIEDQTSRSAADVAIDDYGATLSAEAVAAIEDRRTFAGNQVVGGSRSFIRSRLDRDGDDVEATVFMIEKVERPAVVAPNHGDLFVSWEQYVLSLVWEPDQWQLVAYQQGGVSEYEKFTQPVWREYLDSGRDWRRFTVGK